MSPEYYDQYAQLRSKTSIPIAGGECEYLRFGFKRLLDSKSVDIIQVSGFIWKVLNVNSLKKGF